MKLVCRIIYWLAVAFIALIILIWLAAKLIPLDFREDSYEEYFIATGFFGIPTAIIATITKIGFILSDKECKKKIITNRILMAVVLIIVGIIYFTSTALDGMCGWSKGEVIFKKKDDNDVKLVRKDFGCGAVDGSLPDTAFFSRAPVTPIFYYYKTVDTSKTDMSVWEKEQP